VNDIKEPLEYIRNKYCVDSNGNQIRDIFLIGNSMGAGMSANYLGLEGDKCIVKAACCVQPAMRMWYSG
jgi:predicted alpha/beta-fold hydrolase